MLESAVQSMLLESRTVLEHQSLISKPSLVLMSWHTALSAAAIGCPIFPLIIRYNGEEALQSVYVPDEEWKDRAANGCCTKCGIPGHQFKFRKLVCPNMHSATQMWQGINATARDYM